MYIHLFVKSMGNGFEIYFIWYINPNNGDCIEWKIILSFLSTPPQHEVSLPDNMHYMTFQWKAFP